MEEKKVNRMMAFLSKHMMACDEAAYLISKSYESRLSFQKRIGLKMHLLSCNLCRNYEKQLTQLNKLVESYKVDCLTECHHHLDSETKDSINKCVCNELKNNS